MRVIVRSAGALRALLRRTRQDQELDDELRAYLEAAAERHMAAGMTPDEAHRAARVEMGSQEAIKERVRDVGWESLVTTIVQDLRSAIRMLGRSPVFTAVAVLTLALGIGANTAVFSIMNSLLLRSLPVDDPSRLVMISAGDQTQNPEPWTFATWDEISRRAQAFDGAFAWSGAGQLRLTHAGDQALVPAVYASGSFFTTLRVPAVLGRTLTEADDVRGGGPEGAVAVISYGLWQRRFRGDASVAGTPILLDGVPFTIVGVAPRGFSGVDVGRAGDIFVPLGTEPLIRGNDSRINDALVTRWLHVMLRLAPRQSMDEAAATLRAMQPAIRDAAMPATFPQTRQEFLQEPFTLLPGGTGASGLRVRYARPLFATFVLVGLVLLAACTNLASLLLARATARRHEYAVRLAIGAPRWRVARQLLVESVVLSAAGAGTGLLVAAWGSRALLAQLPDRVSLDLPIDWRVTGFTAGAGLVTALLFGIAPAWRALRVAPVDALKGSSAVDDGRPALWGRARIGTSGGLLAAQVAVSSVLVIAASLLVGTFHRLASVPLGFDPAHLLVAEVDAIRAPVKPLERVGFYQRLTRTVADLPDVAHAAASIATPLGNSAFFEVIVGSPGTPPESGQERRSKVNFVTPGWFATYGVPVHRGRDVRETDTLGAEPVMIVNDAFVRTFFAGRDPVGEALEVAAGGGELPMGVKRIVGIAGDTVTASLRGGMPPVVYVPVAQWNFPVPMFPRFSLSVRPRGVSPAAVGASVETALKRVEPGLSVSSHPLSDQVTASLAQERLLARLSGLLGAIALVLATIGVYGVTSYGVEQRRREIGVRIALGATGRDVLRLVVLRSSAITAAGVAAGLAAAAALTRYLEGMLFGVTPVDPMIFGGVAALFLMVTACAALIPARHAVAADPLRVLRCE